MADAAGEPRTGNAKGVDMKRAILVLTLTAAVVAAACGGGDKKPITAPTSTPDTDPKPTATAQAAGSTPRASSSEGGGALSDLMGLMFNSGLGEAAGGGSAASLGAPDPELGQYLLKRGDLPDGYASMGEFAFTAPDDGTELAGAKMAASMFSSGDLESDMPTDASVVMSMIIQPDDASALEDAFAEMEGSLSQEELMNALGDDGESFPGLEFIDVGELDTDGLGEHAAGLGLTLDMSGFFEAMAEAFGGEMSDEDRAAMDAFSSITMRMYLFERGGLGAAVMRIAFGDADESSPAGDLNLARTLYGRLD